MSVTSLIRPAVAAEAEQLSELTLRSKGFWGYDVAFLDACRDELSVDADYMDKNPVYVIEHESRCAGIYSLEHIDDSEVELGLLFVEPKLIGSGLGRQLMGHAKQKALELGYSSMLIQGDPNAASFYSAAGGEPAGQSPSLSIPGRMLPLFRLKLTANTAA